MFLVQIHTTELKPVMVWIYGGGFEVGWANRDLYGPDYFMKKGIVLVTLNYRVGCLGNAFKRQIHVYEIRKKVWEVTAY